MVTPWKKSDGSYTEVEGTRVNKRSFDFSSVSSVSVQEN